MSSDITDLVLNNLNKSYETKDPIDEKLIDNYTLILTKELIYENDNLNKLITILNHILNDNKYFEIDPNVILLHLLNKILSFLNFKQILEFYSEEFITKHLFSFNNSTIDTILCIGILTSNLHQFETQQYILKNDVIKKLIEEYFNEDTPIEVLNSIEKLIENLYTNELNLLDNSFDIFEKVKNSDNSILVSRYLDLLLILSTKFDSLNSNLYQFNTDEILKFKHDTLFLVILIQFYIKLCDTTLTIDKTLFNIITLYRKKEFDEIINLEIINLISKMSYTSRLTSILEHFQIFKTHNLIKIFDKDEEEIKLLSQSNPNLIYNLNNDIFSDVLVNLPLFDDKFFPILLNFIKSPDVWNLIKPKLNEDKLQKLSKYKLFLLLLTLSQYEWSKIYFFENLSKILSEEIINSDIRNNEIWNLKLEILENLNNTEDNVSGYAKWNTQLKQAYDKMRFGENFKNIQPKVEVIDEAM
ncbi:HSM3 [Candida pseudojiufengensis]|uniref:HSM3 n=1 Tax=Candida pseudojiufengensis TaxID=497109 RepID=UPI0022245EC8|nr:HSM3 [Candida pseudojiufengensis]KAI5959891.1 HSM3 [Candida pseudojiufengensis]